MLRRRLGVAAVVALLSLVGLTAPATADPVTCSQTDTAGNCILWSGGETSGPGGDGPGGGPTGGDGGGSSILTIDGLECVYQGLKDPQPPKSDTVWEGNDEGSIHTCLVIPGQQDAASTSTSYLISFWAGETPEVAVPDPAVLAQQAVEQMDTRAVDVAMVPEQGPDQIGLIGLPSWMWVDAPGAETLGPLVESVGEEPYTVTATGRVDRIVWDMGDGTTVTCEGAGTPFTDDRAGFSSPDCGHTYVRAGEYDVTATSYWVVEWAGMGEEGTITFDLTSEVSTVRLGELQVLTG